MDIDTKEKLDKLLSNRDDKIEEFKKISKDLKELLFKYKLLKRDLYVTNISICEMQGHRLSKNVNEANTYDRYGIFQNMESRTCLICGKNIFKFNSTPNDIIVDEEIESFSDVIIQTRIKK